MVQHGAHPLRLRPCVLISLPAPLAALPLPLCLPCPLLLQFGKWVTDNATIGGKFVSASLDERNEFLTVGAPAGWHGWGGVICGCTLLLLLADCC